MPQLIYNAKADVNSLMRTAQLSFVSILLIAMIYGNTQNSANALLDQSESVYTPFDKVLLRIFSPDSNDHHNEIDTIKALVTSSFSQKEFVLHETGLNTSIFEEEIRFSPDLSKFPGDVQTRRDDGVSVTFRIDSDTVVTQSIYVNYHVGKASFDKPSYGFGDQSRVTIEDPDMNRNPDTVDTVSARIWSDTDRGGLFVTLRETGARTGAFEETITFTNDDASSGTRLKVSDGDMLVLKYTDDTLPPPAKLAADGIETVEVWEIFANSVFGSKQMLQETVSSSEPSLLNTSGESISKILAGEHLIVQSEIANNRNMKQPFAYIVQIKDIDGTTVSLSWLSSELTPAGATTVTQSWLPSIPGRYSVEIFVWDNLTNPTVLSATRTMTIEVR